MPEPNPVIAAAPQITAVVADTGNKIVQWIRKLRTAFHNAMELLRQSGNLFRDIRTGLEFAKRTHNVVSRTALVSGIADIVTDAAKQAVRAIPRQLPEMVLVETAKGAASVVLANPDQLYDGPGPHRVTGTL